MGERCIARPDETSGGLTAAGQTTDQQTTGDEQQQRGVMDAARTPCSTTICAHTKACSVVLDDFTRVDLLILLLCLDEQ